jgi:hypothetical protein
MTITLTTLSEEINRVDARLAFLHRAHARLILFENGLMSLDEAYSGLMEQYCACCRDRRPA